MALNDFSNITVSADGPALTQIGFGTLGLLAHKVPSGFVERSRTYSSLSALEADGFNSDDHPAHEMARIAFSPKTKVRAIKILRLTSVPVQTVRVIPVASDSTTYEFTVTVGSYSELISYTSDASATVDEICDGIQAAVAAALAGVTVGTATDSVAVATGAKSFVTQTGLYLPVNTPIVATSALGSDSMTGTVTSYNRTTGALVINVASVTGSGTDTDWTFTATFLVATPDGGTATYLDLTTTTGEIFALSDFNWDRLKIEDRTPDPGIAADLAAIRLADSDFYGVAEELNTQAISRKVADWAEANLVVHACDVSDWQASDSAVTTDLQSRLHALSYARTTCYAKQDQGTYAGVAALAERFPFDPGTPPGAGGTFHAKTLVGVETDNWDDTRKANLKTKGYTLYMTTAGLGLTIGGKSASGEFLDFTRFNDWFVIRLQERFVLAQANNDRIGMTDEGISVLLACCNAQLKAGRTSKGVAPFLSDGVTEPGCTAPLVADVSAQDRAARHLGGGGLTITYRYAGAIHDVDVGINVSV